MMGGVFAAIIDVTTFTGTITVNATGTFDIYQIFKIVELDDALPGEGKFYNYKMIVNPEFYPFFADSSNANLTAPTGTPTDVDKYTYASNAAAWLAGEGDTAADAKALALTLKTWVADNSSSVTAADENLANGQTSGSLPYGYYLVVDQAVSSENNYLALLTDDGDSYPLTLTPKSEQLDVVKEIYHNEEGTSMTAPDYTSATGAGGWGDVGDNQIGDIVYFRAEATLPTDVSAYTDYYYTLIDFMDETLSFNNDLVIHTDSYTGTALTEGASDDYTSLVKMPQDANQKDAIFAVQLDVGQVDDLIQAGKDTLYLTYSATLTEEALLADDNQQNTLHLLYSVDSINEWTGDVPDSPDDYDEEDDEFDHKEDEVYDYTFKVSIIKTDEHGTPLSGVEFKLTDDKDNDIKVTEYTGTGSYPGNVYYVDAKKSGDSDKIITDDDGEITILGLDDYNKDDSTGVIYQLHETVPKDGYSLLTDYVEFYYVAAYTGAGATLEDFTAYVADDTSADHLEISSDDASGLSHDSNGIDIVSTGVADATITIINTSGTVLPETGGVGTVMFYVAGIGMMAAAGFLIYSKKKNS